MVDFKHEAAMHRGKQLQAQLAAAQSRLAHAEAIDDLDSAAEAIDEIAAVERAGTSLNKLYEQEMARRNPPPMTDAEFMAMSPERMMQSPEAVERILGKSKYYSRDMWNDPTVQQRIREGQASYQAEQMARAKQK